MYLQQKISYKKHNKSPDFIGVLVVGLSGLVMSGSEWPSTHTSQGLLRHRPPPYINSNELMRPLSLPNRNTLMFCISAKRTIPLCKVGKIKKSRSLIRPLTLVEMSGLEPPTPTLSGKVFLKCGWNTYCLLTFIYENFSTTKFLLQQNKSNLLLQFVANVLIFDILFVLKRSKTI